MADFADAPVLDKQQSHRADGADVLRLGFMPLSDCAPLIVADARGLFRKHGVSVRLTPLHAWVAMRDLIGIGHLDGGQMLSPMPIAAGLGLGGIRTNLAVVSVLARQGNTITLGERMMDEIEAAAPELAKIRPLPAAAFAAARAARRAAGLPAPVLAVVYPFSSHSYLLRHWLESAGIDPERHVYLRAVPPPLVAGALADGHIDGFCAGQPWGSRAVDLRCGRIALTTADIWPDHPEKVFAVSADRLARSPGQVAACVAALIEAGIWLSDPANLPEAARLVHLHALPGVPQAVVAQSLGDTLVMAPDEAPVAASGLQFGAASTYPHPEHGAWWLSRMQRWQHAPDAPPGLIDRIWRPDIWRQGAELAGISTTTPPLSPCPGENAS